MSAPKPISSSSRRPGPPDIFTALSNRLRAYAVFLPRTNIHEYEPLSIVELKESDDRKERPSPLHLSLLRIVQRVLQTRQSVHPSQRTTPSTLFHSCRLAISNLILSFYSPESDAAYEAWAQLRRDLASNVTSRHDARSTRSIVTKVSTNSLRQFKLFFGYPDSMIATTADRVSERSFHSTIELKSISINSYTGENVHFFLANHARLLYEAILMYRLPQRAVPEKGDRSLLAIVVTQYTGTIIVSTESLDERKGRMTLLSPIIGFAGRPRGRPKREITELEGVIGLGFIVIPIERIDEFKWRFYPSFPVSGREIDENEDVSGKHDFLFRARNWVERKEGASLLDEDGYEDIDISECKSEYAHIQCLLAMQLRDYIGPYKEDDSGQALRLEMSVLMLRSAAELGSELAMKELAVSYRRGLGVQQSDDHAEALETAARSGSALPDPPRRASSFPTMLSTTDYRLSGAPSTADFPDRDRLMSTGFEDNDMPEVRMQTRKTMLSGHLLGRRNIWIERTASILGDDAWWMPEDAESHVKRLEPVGRLRQLSTRDKTGMHMRALVRQGDQIEITLQAYHAHARRQAGVVRWGFAPRTGEVLKVYSLTREINDDCYGLGLRQRAIHLDEEWTDSGKTRYLPIGYWQSSIFEDCVSQDTNGITIQVAAEEVGVVEGFDGEPFRYIDSNRFDPFSLVVENSVRGMRTVSHHGRDRKAKKRVLMPEQQWMFAKIGEEIRQWESPKYLRYGHYFVLEHGTDAQLFSVVSDANPRLYVRDSRKGTFVALEEFDYYVMKVSLCIRAPRPWMRSKVKRTAQLRKICNTARNLDARTLQEEIIGIMEGRRCTKHGGRRIEALENHIQGNKIGEGRNSEVMITGGMERKESAEGEREEVRSGVVSSEDGVHEESEDDRAEVHDEEMDDGIPQVEEFVLNPEDTLTGSGEATGSGDDHFEDAKGFDDVIFEGQF